MNMSDLSSIVIEFPWSIADLSIPLESGQQENSYYYEDVKWMCLEYLKDSRVCETLPSIGDGESEEELVNLLPAFGLMDPQDDNIWLPPNHVFRKSVKKQTYKFRVRHRPPSSQIYVGNSLLSEFFVLQVLHDFLKGSLAKNYQVSQKDANVEKLLAIALMFPSGPSCLPLENSFVVDKKYKRKDFNVFNYHKKFSRSIYKEMIPTKSKYNQCIDHYLYYRALSHAFDRYRACRKTLEDYKILFLKLFFETYPAYCFQCYQSTLDDKKVDVVLNLYDELKEQSCGIYIDEMKYCDLDDLERVHLQEVRNNDVKQWSVELERTSSSKLWDKNLLFDNKEMAVSYITMLQGYMTLCLQPEKNLCRPLVASCVKVRNDLKSFCPISHGEAIEYLMKNENDQKPTHEQCRFLIYQSTKHLHYFHVAAEKSGLVCDIRWLDGKGYLLIPSPPSDQCDGCLSDPMEFENHADLRCHLCREYGQQLFARKVRQSIDPDSMFYVKKVPRVKDVDEEVDEFHHYVLEGDIDCYHECQRDSLEDQNLKRWLVDLGENRRFRLELVQQHKNYMEGFDRGIFTIAKLSRLHPKAVLKFYGSVTAPVTRLSVLFEHSEFGDLVKFLRRNSQISTSQKMELARGVVRVYCQLSQPNEASDNSQRSNHPVLRHGNLRGHNFYVFKSGNGFYLKVGDPGLVHYYNRLPLTDGNNDTRIPWLSPERKTNLEFVTVATECYAVATTIAEIFHGTDDFKSVLKLDPSTEMMGVFANHEFRIPPPEFPESVDAMVMQSVRNVTRKLWETLDACWNVDPQKRPLPEELNDIILELEEEARAIPNETVLGHLKGILSHLYQVPKQALTSMSDCLQIIEKRESYFLHPNDFQRTKSKSLGQGFFGCVYEGVLRKSELKVAIKENNDQANNNQGQARPIDFNEELLKEFDLSASLRHANIVKTLFYSYTGLLKPCIIMEYMNHGSLNDFSKTNGYFLEPGNPNRNSYIRCLLGLCLDIVKGMAYLEQEKVVHCDLAARNVLLHKDPTAGNVIAKVADFGLAKMIHKDMSHYYYQMNQPKKPFCWYAPEYLVLDRDGKPRGLMCYTTAGDVWAFGVTMLEMFTKGKRPIDILQGQGIRPDMVDIDWLYRYIMRPNGPWPREDYVDQEIYDVMRKCWSKDDRERPLRVYPNSNSGSNSNSTAGKERFVVKSWGVGEKGRFKELQRILELLYGQY